MSNLLEKILYYLDRDDLKKVKDISEKIYEIQPGIFLNIVPYEILKEIKLRSHREKDMFDIARLEEIRNQQNPDNKP